MSDSEDDVPFVAKRSNISKQGQGNSDGIKAPLFKQDFLAEKQVAGKRVIANGKVNGVQAAKVTQPGTSKSLAGVAEGSKSSVKQAAKLSDEDDDSEDEKPLSARMSSGQSKGNSISGICQSVKPKPAVKRESEDSDDEIPLSKRYQRDHSAGTSSTGKVPQQNGSIKKEGLSKSPAVPSKRPLDNAGSSSQSTSKKAKPSDGSQVVKSKTASVKEEEDDDDHVPIGQRTKSTAKTDTKSSSTKQKATKAVSTSFKKTSSQSIKKETKSSQYSQSSKVQPSSDDGQKWTTLVHNGVIFPPPYKPHGVKILYKGKPVDLTPEQEEVATFYADMRDSEYLTNEEYQKTFKENFMSDWRKLLGKKHVIQDLDLCDFTPIYEYKQKEKEKKKQMTSEEKKAAKEEKLKLEEKYMWAIVDGVKEKVGNFRVEPPGLFRGRGKHPKMGKLKRRIHPSDITINIGKDAPIPECPIPGESWKEIKHDNTVTWLAFWNDPINPKEFKYVFLAASSSLKGQSDKEKYEKARKLKDHIDGIRAAYSKDFGSKDVTKQQIAVATYLIDKLALRAGNEKDDDEADTVGCCTLKVENVKCVGGNKLEFDFLGKDSIRYQNVDEVVPPVYKAISQFQAGKKGSDDLFDKLDTSKLNAHLKGLMPGLTAKVFRTYNASITLDKQLHNETKEGEDVNQKLTTYNLANKQVAIICNHQRSVSKSHEAQVGRLDEKIKELKDSLKGLQKDLINAKKGKPPLLDKDGTRKKNFAPEALQKKIDQANAKIAKLESDKDNKESLKTVALGTSKINYLDPRISVAWCKRHEVPIEKIFNKSLLAKFAWSLDVDPSFRF